MKKTLAAAAALLFCLAGSSAALARTDELRPDRPGVDVAVRAGYALPFGDIDGNNGSLSSRFSGAVPLIVELGVRFDRRFTLGPYFQYGWAQVKDNSSTGCSSSTNCSGWVVRTGLEALYHLNVDSALVPWVGLGVGYEWAKISGSALGVGASTSAHGWEFVNLQLGGDIFVARGFALGPFVSFAIARYDSVSGNVGGLSGSSDVSDSAIHEWLQFGLRGAFSL